MEAEPVVEAPVARGAGGVVREEALAAALEGGGREALPVVGDLDDEAPARDVAVSVNLFFTSFAKQAHRSRKGGFTGCANVFSPIPVTA